MTLLELRLSCNDKPLIQTTEEATRRLRAKKPNRADKSERNEGIFVPLLFIGCKSSIFTKKMRSGRVVPERRKGK